MDTGRALEIVHNMAKRLLNRHGGLGPADAQEALDTVEDLIVNNFGDEGNKGDTAIEPENGLIRVVAHAETKDAPEGWPVFNEGDHLFMTVKNFATMSIRTEDGTAVTCSFIPRDDGHMECMDIKVWRPDGNTGHHLIGFRPNGKPDVCSQHSGDPVMLSTVLLHPDRYDH